MRKRAGEIGDRGRSRGKEWEEKMYEKGKW